MDISRATFYDIEELQYLDRTANYTPWAKSVLVRYIEKQSVFIYRHAGITSGYYVSRRIQQEAELLMVVVSPEQRRLGIGRAMLHHMLNDVMSYHGERIFLEVRESNIGAIKLYESFGFNQIGIRANYYPSEEGREDAILYCYEIVR